MFRRVAFFVLRYSGLPFLLRETLQRSKVTIVVYHALAVQQARVHLRALSARYQVIALADYLRARTNGDTQKLPSNPLTLPLDDGHLNNLKLNPLWED